MAEDQPLIGESRWPPAAAVLAFLLLTVVVRIWEPQDGVLRAAWLAPALEGVLLLVLVTSDPTSPAERVRLRRASLVLVALLVGAALWATAVLIHDVIQGEGNTNRPGPLLASGALVWLGNNLAFGLLYWLMDGGGPVRCTPSRWTSRSRSR